MINLQIADHAARLSVEFGRIRKAMTRTGKLDRDGEPGGVENFSGCRLALSGRQGLQVEEVGARGQPIGEGSVSPGLGVDRQGRERKRLGARLGGVEVRFDDLRGVIRGWTTRQPPDAETAVDSLVLDCRFRWTAREPSRR
jgi:hypothetical protein